jgi:transposase-like protein
MSKQIPFEEKICAVKEYLKGNTSQGEQAQRLGVKVSSFQEMVAKYETFGEEGLRKGKQNSQYSADTKRMAVESYLNGEGSQTDICKRYKIRSKVILRKWIKVYNGHKDFKKQTGGSRMTKGRETTQAERIAVAKACIANGKNYGEVAIAYNVSYQQARSWTLKYIEGGESALEDRRGLRKKDQQPRTELEQAQIEIEQLKHKLKMLEMENHLLKKLEEIERRRG